MGIRGDLFHHRYYRINKMLLKCIGLWPHQSIRTRSVITAFIFLIVTSGMLPQAIVIGRHLNDWDFLVECITSLTFDVGCIFKFVISALNRKKLLAMMNRMSTDWDVLAGDRSVAILHEYAEKGRKMTIAYAVAGYTTCVLFTTQPVVPKVIDLLLRNGTEPGEFPVPVDYFLIDEQKYYFYIVLHHSVTISLVFTIVIAYDCLFMVHVHHGCGLYAVLGHKLQRMGENSRPVESAYEIESALEKLDTDFIDLASCIDRHNEAIEYAELIEATYSWCFLIIVAINMFTIITTGLQIVTATIEPQEALRFVVGNVFAMVHLCNECYMAQILMDHSTSIRGCMLNSEWYRLPLKIQKFLILMIMRCNMPSTITAGKMAIMSMEMFMAVLKTSLTYFTVLRSIC